MAGIDDGLEDRPGSRAAIDDLGTGLSGTGYRKLMLGAIGFLGLTVTIFWYQFSSIGASDASPRWADLQWGYLALIVLCLPGETVSSALRIWLLSRVLAQRTRF